jgi:DNA processing protein
LKRATNSSARLALALEAMEGVGRITSNRILRSFHDYEDLLSCPHEQVLLRIKGVPNADKIVARLFDSGVMEGHLALADQALEQFSVRGIVLLTSRNASWPPGLNDLAPAHRPSMLYAYGNVTRLKTDAVAVFGRSPLPEEAFALAQHVVRQAAERKVTFVTGISDGFDVALHRVAAGRSTEAGGIIVASCGMSRLPPSLRPTVSTCVRAGGLFISPFSMQHGPFEHDDRDRACIQAAIATRAFFAAAAPRSPERHAMTWIAGNRPVWTAASLEDRPAEAGIAGSAEDVFSDLYPS